MMAEVISRGSICGKCISARYVMAIFGSFAMGNLYALKTNMSIALVAMLNHTAIRMDHENSTINKHTLTNDKLTDGPFNWDETLQGLILSSYFWGYIVFQIPGGRVAETFSAKWVLFFSVVTNIVCTILTPLGAQLHYSALIVLRIVEGLGGAVSIPAMHVMLSHWAPPLERSFMSGIVYAGTCLGTVLSILSGGVLAAVCGWKYVFYIMGAVCSPWCLFWVWLIQDTPNQQPYISNEERQYINESLGQTSSHKKSAAVPWKAAFTSMPFWAILITHVCSNWGWYMYLIELPFYMTQVLHFKIKENAVLTATPFLTMWLFSIIISKILDWLRVTNVISTTTARKIATLIASVIPAIILVALCYIKSLRWLAVLLMTVAITIKGAEFCGFLSNHIDIAPNFAGTLVALTNTVATVPGIIVPIFVGKLTHGNQTIEAWRIIFFVTVALYVIEIIVYSIFGSGEEQSWNKVTETDTKNNH